MTQQTRKDAAERALPLVDLTNLNDHCSHADIDALCERAHTPFGTVGAICIWPRFVAHAHSVLRARSEGKIIPIATVVNFPNGNASVEMTEIETRAALDDGADEIDLVISYQAFAKGDVDAARQMVSAIAAITKDRGLLKVILETGELGSDDIIRAASDVAIEAGADFIKTSTGKVPVNATPDSAKIMLEVIAAHGGSVGFKPAGGVKTVEDTMVYLDLADTIVGKDWANPKTFRFGASGVLDDLLAALRGESGRVSEGY